MTRRSVVGAALLGAFGTACAGPGSRPAGQPGPGRPTQDRVSLASRRHSYGPGPAQFGDLSLPDGAGPHPVAVVIHGGFWREQFDASLGLPLAADLIRAGYAAWNLEYRRVGGDGGWPETLLDVAAGIDLLASLPESVRLDLDRVATVGHSAGGQLAVWAAARPGLARGAPGADPVVAVAAAVSQAGVLDLRQAAADALGGGAVAEFLGGGPEDFPERYAVASPAQRLPIGVPVLCVHGDRDGNVPLSQSQRYADAAAAVGDEVEVVVADGDHFVVIDVGSPAWAAVVDRLPALLAG